MKRGPVRFASARDYLMTGFASFTRRTFETPAVQTFGGDAASHRGRSPDSSRIRKTSCKLRRLSCCSAAVSCCASIQTTTSRHVGHDLTLSLVTGFAARLKLTCYFTTIPHSVSSGRGIFCTALLTTTSCTLPSAPPAMPATFRMLTRLTTRPARLVRSQHTDIADPAFTDTLAPRRP